MPERRSLLKSLLASLVACALPRPGRAEPRPGFHLVDGWVLTDADLEHLAADAR